MHKYLITLIIVLFFSVIGFLSYKIFFKPVAHTLTTKMNSNPYTFKDKDLKFIITANNLPKVLNTASGDQAPSLDTLKYFLSKILKANFNTVKVDFTSSSDDKPDSYYYNVIKALQDVNKGSKNKLYLLVVDGKIRQLEPNKHADFLNKYFNIPEIVGFYVDEPSAKEFDHLAIWSKYFSSLKKSQPLSDKIFIVNLFGENALSNYLNYVNEWLTKGDPSIIGFDNYAVWDDNEASKHNDQINNDWAKNYYYNFEIFRSISLNNNIPFLNWILVHKHFSTYSKRYYRRASAEDLKFQIYSALAYGSMGVLYYNFWNPDPIKNNNGWNEQFGLVNYNGTTTPLYDSAAVINKKLNSICGVLYKLKSKGVFHISNVTNKSGEQIEKKFSINPSDNSDEFGMRLLPKDGYDFIKTVNNKEALLGLFKDDANSNYLMIVNKNRYQLQKITLQFNLRNKTNKLLDVSKNTYIKLDSKNTCTITLLPGDGNLFKVVGK